MQKAQTDLAAKATAKTNAEAAKTTADKKYADAMEAKRNARSNAEWAAAEKALA